MGGGPSRLERALTVVRGNAWHTYNGDGAGRPILLAVTASLGVLNTAAYLNLSPSPAPPPAPRR